MNEKNEWGAAFKLLNVVLNLQFSGDANQLRLATAASRTKKGLQAEHKCST